MNNKDFSILRSIIRKNARIKECFLGNCDNQCSTNIINAHSLQRMGSLSILESNVNNNNSLYTITSHIFNEATGLFELLPIGKHHASTFFGFCGKHDSEIFKSIEDNSNAVDINSDEHCFLLSFRAFAISYHRKKEQLKLFSTQDSDLKKKIMEYYQTNDIEILLEGTKDGLKDLEINREILVDLFLKKDYAGLEYYAFELDYTVPIAACMATSPHYFLNGKLFNHGKDRSLRYSNIITTVIPLKERTVVIMAAFDDKGSEYLDEISQMCNLKRLKALTWHILADMENFFISPKWFDKFSEKEKSDIIYFCITYGTIVCGFYPFSEKFPYNFFDKKHSI